MYQVNEELENNLTNMILEKSSNEKCVESEINCEKCKSS